MRDTRDDAQKLFSRKCVAPCVNTIKHNALPGSIQSLDLDSSLTEDGQFREFRKAAEKGNLVPIYERLFSDQLTPVNAYRCLVGETDHDLPSFLYESVVNGDQTVLSPSLHALKIGDSLSTLEMQEEWG